MNKINIEIDAKRIIKTEEIEGTDFVYFEDEIIINNNSTVKIGITSKENISKVKNLDRIDLKVYAPKMYENYAYVSIITKKDFDLMLKGKKHISDVINNITKEYNENIIVLWNPSSYKIADLNYNFLSIPINFNYIDGNITNEYYDLNKMLEILKNDERVIDRENLNIYKIPYYNATDESNKEINFKYLLTNKEYNELMKLKLDSYDTHEYILKNYIGIDKINYED